MALESMTNTEKGGDDKVSSENKENATTASSSVSDAISAAAATSNPTQTRFSFYDAAEVQLQISGSDGSKEDPGHPNRYNFYNALELDQQKQLQEKQEQTAKSDDGTEDILRSLQETEEQRMQILQVDVNPTPVAVKTRRMTPSAAPATKAEEEVEDFEDDGSNPYEDAIKEALDLLRRHRSPPVSPAVVVTGGPGDLQPHHRSITPKEHDRLLQMRQEDSEDDVSHTRQEQEQEDITDLLEEQRLKAKQRQERMAQYASRLQEFKSSLPAAAETEKKDESDSLSVLSQSTKQRDEEVQRGVEKVLLAILEKAHTSRERARPAERIPQETMNDALLRAMDELLQGPKCDNVLQTKSMDSNPSKVSERSVVDELLAEDEECDMVGSSIQHKHAESQQALSAKCREETKLPDPVEKAREEDLDSDHDTLDKYATEQYDEADEEVGVTEGADKAQDRDYDDHSPQNDSQSTDRVLGPLSKRAGGTTGVVLDIATDDEASTQSVEESADGTADFSSVMNDVDSSINQDPTSKNASFQEYHAGSDADKEAAELMRTLCAHLLPFGVDASNRLREAIPSWDDENPNEAGYRIIRLSKAQLRRVEHAFESMIKDFKKQSEKLLNDKDAPTSNGFDANFYKDLQEAEKLLDDEERRVMASSAPKPLAHDEPDFDKASAISLDTNYSQCHPDFPGIKSTGKGEMGDLEYFHLPIIFKSHVTGFEPTKDMALEPGNVVAGQYLVENELGSAAFSTAYRCIDLSSEMQGVR